MMDRHYDLSLDPSMYVCKQSDGDNSISKQWSNFH